MDDVLTATDSQLDSKDLNRIIQGDCIAGMADLPASSVDLAFADPPFNIGYEYDVYKDKLGRERYLDWSRDWIGGVHRVLKDDGTFWLVIGDEYAAELKILSQEIGFHCRSWVIWYYTFGVNCKNKFTRSHAHMFYFVKDPDQFTFRADDLENRIPSARELVYNDKRANPKGRLPDDTWMIRPADVVGEIIADDGTWSPEDIKPQRDDDRTWILRPQDIESCFQADEDTWYFPRVAGTFKERQGFHGCQMPEQLLGRIIRSCSEQADVVLDPFSGSATTLAVAKKLGRKFLGFELSEDYAAYGKERLASIRVGDRLDGSAEPTKSAPKTSQKNGQQKQRKGSKAQRQLFADEQRLAEKQLELTLNGVAEAFLLCHQGSSIDRVVIDPDLNAIFIETCRRLGLAGEARTWNTLLFRLRRSGKLVAIETDSRINLTWEDVDPFLYGSEIALQTLLNEKRAADLNEVFCDPQLANEFDQLAESLAPGRTSLEYRWAALMLHQHLPLARQRAALLAQVETVDSLLNRLSPAQSIAALNYQELPETAAVYLLNDKQGNNLYVGETLNLQRRIKQMAASEHEMLTDDQMTVQWIEIQSDTSNFLTWQCHLAKQLPAGLIYCSV